MASEKGTKKRKRHRTRDLLRALKHEIRRMLMRRFISSEEPLSPAKLAKRTKYPLATVAYHVGVLRETGTLNLVDERQARGAAEHLYESNVDDDPAARTILDETEKEDEDSQRKRRKLGGKRRRKRGPL